MYRIEGTPERGLKSISFLLLLGYNNDTLNYIYRP